MIEADPSLIRWGWFFLSFYIALMMWFGYVGMRKVKGSDDFATARGGYGPWFLALALVATTASGGTFIGLPALAYKSGYASLWYAFVYPLGVYIGVIICMRAVRRAGAAFGNRSMPEYLGDRYDSDVLRVVVAIASMLLLFYLAAQLLSGAVMFNTMLGLDVFPALLVTSVILMLYIVVGGAHADILTDGVQGGLMLLLAIAVAVMFFTGFGVVGGYSGMVETLREADPNLLTTLNPTNPLFDSWWDVVCIFVAHSPLGLLPHIGNKLWALKEDRDQVKFVLISFIAGLLLPALAFGGILCRAVVGDALLQEGSTPNDAVPVLFIATLPTWLAALVGAGVLAAVMSTADGLVVSTSQIFANDIYRRTIVPAYLKGLPEARADRIGLLIGRVTTVLTLAGAIAMAWYMQTINVAIVIWIGVGGMMAAIAGPLFLGVLWRGATRPGALAGFAGGLASFTILKIPLLPVALTSSTALGGIGPWLLNQSGNPYACATLGIFVSLALTYAVSLVTRAPDEAHLARVFG